jgi:hypothetical protein
MKLAMLAAAMITLASGAQLAAADSCKNVDLKVTNSYRDDGAPVQIKVIDFDYWDDTEGKWREEAVIGNLIVNPSQTSMFVENRTLSFVGNENGVQIRVQFKYLTQNNGWSDTLDAYSEPFFCSAASWAINNVTVEVE